MEVEIVDFYFKERNDEKERFTGSLHVYLPEIQVDVRNFFVLKYKQKWRFWFPIGFGIDPETGKKVRFPIFCFLDAEKNAKMLDAIRKKGIEFIEENYLSKKKA